MSRIKTFVLVGRPDMLLQTLAWMLRRTCGGMSASASSWKCSFVGLHGLIVSVTHHHYIDSISFKLTWARYKILCFVDMHVNSWFIEAVPIDMLSCHRQHINSIRHGWHFCSQFSLLNYFNVWINKYSGLCMPILRSLNLYIGWILAVIWLYLFTV